MDETVISSIPLFAALPATEIQFLANTLQPRVVAAGTTIIKEGGSDDRFYILLEGRAEVFKTMVGEERVVSTETSDEPALLRGDERFLAVIEQGSLIGEMGLFSQDSRHTASVRALTPMRLLEMTREDFDSLLQRQPVMTYDLVRTLSQRLERSENVTIIDLQEKNRQLTIAYRELQQAQAQIVEKEKLEHELELARQIQLAILPDQIPALPGFGLGATIAPARAVGGDFYDFIPLGDDLMGIVVGDVSDKGIPAAMYMSLTYGLIRAEARRTASPADTLNQVNKLLLEVTTSGMFVTVLYGILNKATREFRFARAGHEYPIILNSSGQPIELMPTSGRLMGILDDLDLHEESVQIPRGGMALIFSDGVTEAMNRDGEQFGASRAEDFLCQNMSDLSAGGSSCQICERLLSALRSFVGPEPQHDDITIVAIQG
jgi:serine phosphatase RsbU (regulator of sigma subunit)